MHCKIAGWHRIWRLTNISFGSTLSASMVQSIDLFWLIIYEEYCYPDGLIPNPSVVDWHGTCMYEMKSNICIMILFIIVMYGMQSKVFKNDQREPCEMGCNKHPRWNCQILNVRKI